MGNKTRRKHRDDTSTSSSYSDDDESSETSVDRRRRSRKNRKSSEGSSKREKEKKRGQRRKRKERDRDRDRNKDRDRKKGKSKKRRDYYDSESGSSSDSGSVSETINPEDVVRDMLKEFPNVGSDLKQLLEMIDDGQAVDIKGISERSLIKHLKKLFVSLNLKENGDRVFLLPSNHCPTLEVVGHLINSHLEPKEQKRLNDVNSVPPAVESKKLSDDNNDLPMASPGDDLSGPKRRMMGPEMPSAELLAAAAKLTEAQAELREVELEEDTELFIGPPPPAMVAEAESANEAERFEEVTRIMAVEDDSPYDVVGVNHNMSAENIKKRYWKMSLLVHPDKCSHPQAHQAFIKLNKAFKELQDPDKRKLLDEQIKLKEEQEAFKVELKAMREAAQWRRLQGISMEGDDELLAEMEVKVAPQRDEWMTTLPPERKPGMTMQSTTRFGKCSKEGRGDTSVWTDTPSDRAQKAKMK
ncbi:splicing factor, arginine/serine-rich 19 isoform X2 [Ricinus communis]|uniref:splicing factor, arginine/serine-rich 19 isoform X2 n=1 Tax=Ricinus communis TaxID=3988 RepID=UPI0007729D15|nr:splicing factor, arginine/serine-rich 19 isoform X2 [Ricinus communis]|eukprot:XP_015579458.1 splicing factor, arginine/serine-rich 19 isoform X2 [Ricinus communis]